VRPKPVARWEVGVLELTVVSHPEPLHHRDRAAVRRNGERHDFLETGFGKAERDRGMRGLGRIRHFVCPVAYS
jgi:hypothetical protein